MYDLATDSVKVTDFGIARITDSSKTKTGLVLGTPSFMSPEQIAGKKIDGRSDLYSLGVMLYQMLAGVLPFRGESMAELMYKIANEPAPDVRLVQPAISEKLASLVALSIGKLPADRFQDGDSFAAELRALGAGANVSAGAGDVGAVALAVTSFAAADVASGAVQPSPEFEATVVHVKQVASFERTVVSRAVDNTRGSTGDTQETDIQL